MRNFINILETQLSEMMLYRGDGSHIETFEMSKTDAGALLGPGLYLTTDPVVAGDYTAARGDEKLYPRDRYDEPVKSVKDLMVHYIASLCRTDFDEKEFERNWKTKNGFDPNQSGMPSKKWDELRYDQEEAKTQFMNNRKQYYIDLIRKDLPNMRVFKLTTGELRLVRSNRSAVISSFNIPDDYVAKTLNADMPLPDDALVVVKKLFDLAFPHGNMDLRDSDRNDKRVDFDTFVNVYKTRGTRRAWADDEDPKIGGKGQNPSLDDFMNGTHAGNYVFTDGMFDKERPLSTRMIAEFRKLGYVGFEYHGGKRLGAYVRGGGGRKHRAFVFWDVPYIQKCRMDHHPLPNTTKITSRSLPSV